LGVAGTWESRLGLAPGELNERMKDAWAGGSIGTISEADVHRTATENLGLDEQRLTVEPAQMVFVDDYEPCVEGARQAGIHAVLYRNNAQAVRDIEDLLAR
jgi:FMN phosphatase YigB (HAD superfamily)